MVYLQAMVYKFFIRLAFVLSVCFLLLHNLTPHVHHTEMSEEHHISQHEEARTLYDWLMLSFHDDLGGGHLECFAHLEKIQLNPVWNFVIPSDLFPSNPFQFTTTTHLAKETFLKYPIYRQTTMERICHEQNLFDRPPPEV